MTCNVSLTWGNRSKMPLVWIISQPNTRRSNSVSLSKPSEHDGLGFSFSGGIRTLSRVSTILPYFWRGRVTVSLFAVAILDQNQKTSSNNTLVDPKADWRFSKFCGKCCQFPRNFNFILEKIISFECLDIVCGAYKLLSVYSYNNLFSRICQKWF